MSVQIITQLKVCLQLFKSSMNRILTTCNVEKQLSITYKYSQGSDTCMIFLVKQIGFGSRRSMKGHDDEVQFACVVIQQ